MDTAKARKHMVDSQVRPNDVTDSGLIKAMGRIPREDFVPSNRRSLAYVEKDVPLFEGRWLLKARDFSKLINEAHIHPGDLVLDVGCGYGYGCAVMAPLASVVVGLEDNAEAVSQAQTSCTNLGLDNVAIVEGELAAGFADQGPYDVIVIAGGAEIIPEKLFDQLSPEGGRMVAILVDRGVGHAMLYTRHHDAIGERMLFECHPAGILPGFNRTAGFVF